MLLSIPLLFLIQRAGRNLLAPFRHLGVFYIIVGRMLENDISSFIVLFVIWVFNYGMAMYLNVPSYVMESL